MIRKILKVNFPNGWTVSIAPDTSPGCWNIMAWPTRHDNRPFDCMHFYVWKGEETKIDCRLWSIADLVDRLQEIATAQPPQ